MSQTGIALAQVVVTTVAASAIGALLLGRHFRFHHAATRWAAQTAAGFLVISYAIFALALAGLTTRSHLSVFLTLLVPGAAAWLIVQWRRIGTRWMATAHFWPTLAAVCYFGWILLCASLPPLATDELIHHLAVPRQMLEAGGTVPFPDNIYAYFPPFGEMLFLFGLGVGGEIGARLFHAVFGVILATALFGYSRRYLSGSVAHLPALLFFTAPSVMVILPWAYVDLIFPPMRFWRSRCWLSFSSSDGSDGRS